MSDELERLENALRASTPNPTEEARMRALSAANAAFESYHQGNRTRARQKGQVSQIVTLWFPSRLRSFAVPLPPPALALVGTACIIIAGVFFYRTLLGPAALSPSLTTVNLANPTDLPASSPAHESTSQLRVEPTAPLVDTPPPGIDMMTKAEVAEVMERIAPPPSLEPVKPADLDMQSSPPDILDTSNRAEVFQGRRLQSRAESLPKELERQARKPPSLAEGVGAGRSSGHRQDRFTRFDPNPVKVAAEHPQSTFSVDVDTASYDIVRTALRNGAMPQKDAVRTEELVNYFEYDYTPPESRDTPFAAHVTLMPAPWNPANWLMQVGIKGYVRNRAAAPRANLVFLVDTSGSMDQPDKLPLLIKSLKLLVGMLAPDDTVAVVTYAGPAGVALAPTRAAERGKIMASLDRLSSGGSTAGAQGIRQAYLLAEQRYIEDGINRVILATGGDFNVGITDPVELESYIARKRENGVFLSVLGFRMGNYSGHLMQRLAEKGNGNATYIDSLPEARKAVVEEATSAPFLVAKDVRVQVEFNPAVVSAYRLIGYESHKLRRDELLDQTVEVSEVGVGHTVTALYEVTMAGWAAEGTAVLRYHRLQEATEGAAAYLKILYKPPGNDTSAEIVRPVTRADAFESVDAAPVDARFASAVAAFGQILRGRQYTGDFSYGDVIALARESRGEDPLDYRTEFVSLVRLAQSVAAMTPPR